MGLITDFIYLLVGVLLGLVLRFLVRKMELRWLVKKVNLNADMVREYSVKWNVSMSTAKKELEKDNTQPTLQFRNYLFDKWTDIPVTYEYIDPPKQPTYEEKIEQVAEEFFDYVEGKHPNQHLYKR